MREAPAPAILPRVLPQCVFAAGRQKFDCIVTGAPSVEVAAAWIITDLPLAQNGWDMSKARIRHTGNEYGEFHFTVERGN